MDAPQNHSWFLRKHEDGRVFGPLGFAQLQRWASAAQVAPHDLLSADQASWMKAPMLPQLQMDWLVELTSERYYGPTTVGAVQEFIRLGEVNAETFVINACDGVRRQIADVPEMVALPPVPDAELAEESGPSATRIALDLRGRIHDLEQSLREERRAAHEAEERYRELEKRYRELVQSQTAREATL